MSIIKSYVNRQRGYTDRYTIEYRQEPRFWTIYATQCPPDTPGKGAQEHHRYSSGKLCQREGRESTSLEHAEAFAHWWMKRYSEYVRTGTFPMTPETVDVPD